MEGGDETIDETLTSVSLTFSCYRNRCRLAPRGRGSERAGGIFEEIQILELARRKFLKDLEAFPRDLEWPEVGKTLFLFDFLIPHVFFAFSHPESGSKKF